jgi:hypothetical protein
VERDLRITEQRVTKPGVVEQRCGGFRALKNGFTFEAFGEEFSRAARGDRLRPGHVQDARRRGAQFQRAQRI